jgi:hypothetical protein
MNWVLLIIIFANNAGAITQIPMQSESICLAAKEKLDIKYAGYKPNIKEIQCIQVRK